MHSIKQNHFFKIISVVLIISFLVMDISWANPDLGKTRTTTLAVPTMFQGNMPMLDFKGIELAPMQKAELMYSLSNIADYFFEVSDNIAKDRENYVAEVMRRELKAKGVTIAEGIDLDSIKFENGVVYITYEINSIEYLIRIDSNKNIDIVKIEKSLRHHCEKLIPEIVQKFDLGRVKEVTFIPGGSADISKTMPKITTEKGDFIIKKLKYVKSLEEALFLDDYLTFLINGGIPIPCVYTMVAKNNNKRRLFYEFLNTSTTPDKTEYYIVEKWTKGKTINRQDASADNLELVGRMLGKIHKLSANYNSFSEAVPNKYTVESFVDKMKDQSLWYEKLKVYLNDEERRLVEVSLKRIMEYWANTNSEKEKVLYHHIPSDMNFANVIFNEEEDDIIAVFDWDQIRKGYRLEDFYLTLVQTGRSQKLKTDNIREDLDAFLKGWREEVSPEIGEAEYNAIPVFFLTQTMYSIFYMSLKLSCEESKDKDKISIIRLLVNDLLREFNNVEKIGVNSKFAYIDKKAQGPFCEDQAINIFKGVSTAQQSISDLADPQKQCVIQINKGNAYITVGSKRETIREGDIITVFDDASMFFMEAGVEYTILTQTDKNPVRVDRKNRVNNEDGQGIIKTQQGLIMAQVFRNNVGEILFSIHRRGMATESRMTMITPVGSAIGVGIKIVTGKEVLHRHELDGKSKMEVMMCNGGNVSATVADKQNENAQEVVLKSGDMLALYPDTFHGFVFDTAQVAVIIENPSRGKDKIELSTEQDDLNTNVEVQSLLNIVLDAKLKRKERDAALYQLILLYQNLETDEQKDKFTAVIKDKYISDRIVNNVLGRVQNFRVSVEDVMSESLTKAQEWALRASGNPLPRVLMAISGPTMNCGSGVVVESLASEHQQRGGSLAVSLAFRKPLLPKDLKLDETALVDTIIFGKSDDADTNMSIPVYSSGMPFNSLRYKDMTPIEMIEFLEIYYERLKILIEEYEPDVIHVNHLFLLTPLVQLIAPWIPVVATTHGTEQKMLEEDGTMLPLVAPAVRRLDNVLSISDDISEKTKRVYSLEDDNISMVGNGFDARMFHPMEINKKEFLKSHGIEGDYDEVVLYIGRFVEWKKLDYLLKAAAEYSKDKTKKVLTLFVGLGSDEIVNKYQEFIQSNKLSDNVKILNKWVSMEEVGKFYNVADVFVLPSDNEPFSLGLLQALASGCKV
ncbi:MAG: glycosyltransferase, partial [Candidatus Omnitrophica bacterium]|nr:glycosyltransferase [Candidatus Omnitrophota bacterium]